MPEMPGVPIPPFPRRPKHNHGIARAGHLDVHIPPDTVRPDIGRSSNGHSCLTLEKLKSRGNQRIKRPTTREPRVDFMPEQYGRLTEAPTEIDRLPLALRREIDQPLGVIFHLDPEQPELRDEAI